MRAAAYLRQSLDRTGEGLAVERQREDCLKLCEQKGWDVTEYVDNDISASSGKKRPAYEQMLKDIEDGRVDAVVCWHLDRLHRRPIELENFIDLADRKKLALATVTGDVNLGTDNGRLIARLTGAVARAEVERKSARQKRAQRQKAEAGQAWGPRAFGYAEDHVTLIPKEAQAIREAFEGFLAGRSMHSVIVEWNKQGLRTTKGNLWDISKLRAVLTNPRYMGVRVYKGERVGEGDWPSIVDEDTFNAVNAILLSPDRAAPWSRGRKNLLGAIIFCGKCGNRLYSGAYNGGGNKYPIYRCKYQFCRGIARKQEPIDEYVTEAVILKLAQIRWAKPQGQVEDTTVLNAQLKTLDERLIELGEAFGEGILSKEQITAATKTIRAKQEDLRGRLATAVREARQQEEDSPEEMWAAMDLDQKRALVGKLCRVTIHALPPKVRRDAEPEDFITIDWLAPQNH